MHLKPVHPPSVPCHIQLNASNAVILTSTFRRRADLDSSYPAGTNVYDHAQHYLLRTQCWLSPPSPVPLPLGALRPHAACGIPGGLLFFPGTEIMKGKGNHRMRYVKRQ